MFDLGVSPVHPHFSLFYSLPVAGRSGGSHAQQHTPVPTRRHYIPASSSPENWGTHSDPSRRVCVLLTEQQGGTKTEQDRLQQTVCQGLVQQHGW